MPVSRNRKKKNVKNTPIKAKISFVNNQLDYPWLDDCKRCEGLRDKFSLKELPQNQQLHWLKSGIVDAIAYFLYCPCCEEYAAILEVD